MPFNWLLRAVRWVRNPPSMRQALIFGGFIAVLIVIAAIERIFGWPDALTLERVRPPR